MNPLITSDATLRLYITNALCTVEGEDTLFERIKHEITIAQQWFEREFPLTHVTKPEHIELATKAIAYHAYALAIPSLDLVLTPTGFGVVNNDNTVPASKDRVASLIANCYQVRDNVIQTLITILDQDATWRTTDGKRWRSTIFLGLDAQLKQQNKDTFTLYQSQYDDLVNFERKIGYEYISQELMARLRSGDNLSEIEKVLLSRLQHICLEHLSKGTTDTASLIACVNTIRNNASLKAIWEPTITGGLYKDYTFKNDKNSGGFWI